MSCACGHHHAPTGLRPRQGDEVTQHGQLICRTMAEMMTVLDHADAHIVATRAEPGCIAFDLRQTEDPLIFDVAEHFQDPDAFHAHQRRTAASEWARATAGLERRYHIEGMPEATAS